MDYIGVIITVIVLGSFLYGTFWYGVEKLKPQGIFCALYIVFVIVTSLVLLFGGAALSSPVFENKPALWKKVFVKKCKCELVVRQ